MSARRIVITGAAVLIGQIFIPRLEQRNLGELVAIDKQPSNTEVIDWGFFGGCATALQDALNTTLCNPTDSKVVLDF